MTKGLCLFLALALLLSGCGWCYEEWYGHNGIVYSAPITQTATYEPIEGYPLYYDTALRDIFQRVNGAG